MNVATVVEPRLPSRLCVLRDLLPAGDVADVGAGHGLLAAHLALAGRRVIAIEAIPGPLAELRANLAAWGLGPMLDVRMGLGLEPLGVGEVDGAVIAGMGGRTAVGIAAAAPSRGLRWIALQCPQRAGFVEAWVDGPAFSAGWRTLEAQVVAERGRPYPTWVLAVGGPVG